MSAALLEVKDCTVAFAGLRAVSELSLQLAPREIVGLIGPNGAGKTTVFNMLTGIYPPSPGTILFEGKSLLGLAPHRINRLGIARTFQNIRLFASLSARENVLLCCHEALATGLAAAVVDTPHHEACESRARAEATRLLDSVGLADQAEERASSLAYGDQRRLEIARALATHPRLLLLDEPTAGMNPREKEEMAAVIARLRQDFGIAILLIEHDMKVVMGISDRVVVMDHGEVIANGLPGVIQKDPAVIEAYLGEEVATA